jgi:hypothetical protein
MKRKELSSLFYPDPRQFSLRGDKAVWDVIKEKFFMELGLDIEDEGIFREKVLEYFRDATGYPLEPGLEVYLKKYDPGHGMSAGVVDFTWWYKVGLPLLVSRFRERKALYSKEDEFLDKLKQERSDYVTEHEKRRIRA